MPFHAGHPCGKAKNDKTTPPQIAVLLRGGMLPHADVSRRDARHP